MIKEEIGLGIVCTLALLFIFYGIGKFIITCIRDEKFIKKADLVHKNAENIEFAEEISTDLTLQYRCGINFVWDYAYESYYKIHHWMR